MLMNFLLPIEFPGASAHRRLQLSFYHFRGLSHAFADVVNLLVVAALDGTLILVALNVILVADDEVRFPRAPALTSTAALAVVALLLS